MNDDMPVEQAEPIVAEREPAESVDRSAEAWHRLWMQLKSITPAELGRGVLVLLLLLIIGWLLTISWATLLPFQIGLVLAYIVLPLVNWLDRFMPRRTAEK